jgi:D-arabinose 1-dehydrogenase-like Zn-dependent alcohol dehydrogenase
MEVRHYFMRVTIILIFSLEGYSNLVTVKEHFVCKVPNSLPLDAAAPLLCAGITTYSPLRRYNVGKDSRIAYLFELNHILI